MDILDHLGSLPVSQCLFLQTESLKKKLKIAHNSLSWDIHFAMIQNRESRQVFFTGQFTETIDEYSKL